MKIKKGMLLFALCMGVAASLTLFSACKPEQTSDQSSSSDNAIVLEETDLEIMVGDMQEIVASGKNLVWSSSDESVVTVNQFGIITGISVGSATITATAENGDSVSCVVAVKRPSIVPVLSLDKTDRVFHANDVFQLEPSMIFRGNEVEGTYTYSSTDTAVAEVDKNGLITAKSVGEATISVVWNCLGYVDIETINVKVVPNAYMELNTVSVELVEEELSENTPNTKQQTVEILTLEIDGQKKDVSTVTWETADETVATVSNGTITAVGMGETYVTATWSDNNVEAVATVQVTVLREAAYTIKHIWREFNGKLTVEEELHCSDLIGTDIVVDQKNYDEYTYSTALSNNSVKLAEGVSSVLNLYYQSHKETFAPSEISSAISGGQAIWEEQEMTGLPADDIRLNTYFFDCKNPKGAANLQLTYARENVGQYLIFQIYYTKYEGDGCYLWTANNDTSNSQWVGVYDVDGNPVEKITTNTWLTYVVYLDSVNFPLNGGVGGQLLGSYSFVITWAHLQENDFYMSDYCFLTPTEFNEYYGEGSSASAASAEIDLIAANKEDEA